MTGRERIRAAMKNLETDRIPGPGAGLLRVQEIVRRLNFFLRTIADSVFAAMKRASSLSMAARLIRNI
jgi:hypothetical protein